MLFRSVSQSRYPPSTAVVDGDRGLGLSVGPYAMEVAIQKASQVGTGWVSVKNSNHFGIAGYHAMLALPHDMIGIAMTNASATVAPTFSKEAGSFTGLLKAWEVAMPTMKQGSKTLGTMVAFGTGGEEGPGFEGLEELFYHPEAYDCLAFENEWDAGALGTNCGFFHPIYKNLDGFIDKDGNSDTNLAIEFELEQREKKKKGNDAKSFDQYVAEHAFTPQEATLQVTGNTFGVTT